MMSADRRKKTAVQKFKKCLKSQVLLQNIQILLTDAVSELFFCHFWKNEKYDGF